MKKLTLILLFVSMVTVLSKAQTITIVTARSYPIGTSVTIQGLITNDASTMGWTWYIQDETAGIAGYSTMFSTVGAKQGDIVKVTGTLKNYNSLLEISPVTEVVVVSSGNTIPDPVVLLIPQIVNGTGGEDHESMLVKVNNIHFSAAVQGTTFNAGASGYNYYIFNNIGDSMQMRVLPNTNINGTLIPMGNINMVGDLGQYTTGYQLIPRSLDDITSTSSISLTTPVSASEITTSAVTLSWTTDNPGSSFVKYGLTSSLEKGYVNGNANTTDHSVTIPGTAAQILYAKAFSVSASNTADTAKSITGIYITASNSSGNVKCYFNTPVDNSVSSGTNAISISQAVDDTLINYINRAKKSIDIAIYNFNNDGLSDISAALNSAANRGVSIRIIYCGTTVNQGIDELNSSIHVLQGPGENNSSYPTRNGIMHDKFMVIDAGATNADDPLVWTGSVNWTSDNMNTDANNIIIIQDQSLAKTYTVEFEEMWGSSTLTPNAANAKFGSAKTNNTPHQLKIGGKWVESYFSPSDNVNAEIINRINTANHDLEVATMLVTRKEIVYAVSDVVLAGADAQFLVSSYSDEVIPANPPTYPDPDSTVFNVLKKSCYRFGDYTGGGIMHNKYMIIDQGSPDSDPLVWTGSHNWSGGANTSNDENSVVIHDATLANIYYQNFVKLMTSADILYSIDDPQGYSAGDVAVYPNPATGFVTIDVKASKRTAYRIDLLDMSGRMIKTLNETASAGVNRARLNLDGVQHGLYLVRISGGNGSFVQKLLVQ